MLKALLWKEWQEQRWRMGLACLWLIGLNAIGLTTRILPDMVILGMIWVPSMMILPLFAGIGLLAEERSEKTLSFLMVQPVARRSIITSKLLMGLLVCLAPVLLCGTLIWAFLGARELPEVELVSAFAFLGLFCTVLFLWQILSGIKCRRPETYVAIAIFVLGFWMVFGFVVDEYQIDHRMGDWIWWINPFAVIELLDAWSYRTAAGIWAVIGTQLAILPGLIVLIFLRFNHMRERRS